jgi:hypothetical protein
MFKNRQNILARFCLLSISTTYIFSLFVGLAFIAWHCGVKDTAINTAETIFLISNEKYQQNFENQKEFKIGNDMYDVKHIRHISGDSIEIIANKDDFEIELFNLVQAISDNSDDNDLPSILILLWSVVFVIPDDAEFYVLADGSFENELNCTLAFHSFQWINIIEYPPALLNS